MSNIVKRLGDLIADSLIGRDGVSKVFSNRVSQEFPDYDFIEDIDVRTDSPYMALVIGSQAYNNMYRLEKTSNIQTISNIIHTGVSPASYSISGTHRGNNNLILEIVTSGALGSAEYKLSKDGGDTFGQNLTVPANGQVDIGDGTILAFGSEGNLVNGDIYSWQTVSMKELTYQTDEFLINISIQIYTATKIELLGDDEFTGYIDQLRNFFKERRAIHDEEFIYRVNLDRKAQPYSDSRAGKYRGLLTVIIEGALYHKRQIPLIGAVTEEVTTL